MTAIGPKECPDGKAVDEVIPGTRHQRCWFHKSSNALNKFPKSMAPAVTSDLHDIHHAETKAAALERDEEEYVTKYAPAAACLTKDTGALLTFRWAPPVHA